MKIRNGFVTNSSSTNSIVEAVSTAVVSGVFGALVNIETVSESTEIYTYATLETLHEPEEPKPCEIRVNDDQYTLWYYSSIRIVDVMVTTDEKGNKKEQVIRDEYDDTYTAGIRYEFEKPFVDKFLTFGGDGGSGNSFFQEGHQVCGFVSETDEKDRPRWERTGPPAETMMVIRCTVMDVELTVRKKIKVKDEAGIWAEGAYVLNDASLEAKVPVAILNTDKYDWQLSYEVESNGLYNHANFELMEGEESGDGKAKFYDLVVKPSGLKLTDKKNSSAQLPGDISFKGVTSATHLQELKDRCTITLVDEGLIFKGPSDGEGRLLVKSYVEKDQEEAQKDDEIEAVQFMLQCVARAPEDRKDEKDTAMFLDMGACDIVIGELTSEDAEVTNLLSVYKYEVVQEGSPGTYLFRPKMQIPANAQNRPFYADLHISCDYEEQHYELDMPICLRGEPYTKQHAWEDEYRKLRIIIRKYIPPEQWIDILKEIEAKKDKTSIEELRLMRKSIYETARDKLVAEAAGYETIATVCDWTAYGLEWVQWTMDQALSYCFTLYTGPLGATVAEAILMPFKDVLTMVIADEVTEWIWSDGGAYNEEQLYKGAMSSIFTSFENLINNGADSMIDASSLSIKQLGRYLAAFAVVKCLNHYMCDVKSDGSPVGLWDAIIDTMKDLTGNFFKLIVGKKIEKMIKSEKAEEIFGKYASKSFTAFMDVAYDGWREKGPDLLIKYLTEFGGVISATAYNKTIDIASKGDISVSTDDVVVTLNLSSDPKNPWIVKLNLIAMTERLIESAFYGVFGSFPFPESPVKVTDDPTYFKKA